MKIFIIWIIQFNSNTKYVMLVPIVLFSFLVKNNFKLLSYFILPYSLFSNKLKPVLQLNVRID